jgi:steroid delta-isomerase-like uncharacterized protein
MADLKGHATALIEAFNNNDLDTYMTLAGDGVYNEVATGRSVSGPELRAALDGWKTAFSDVTGTISNTIVVGDQIVQEITWTGTHDGPLLTPGGEIPASGNRQTTPAVIVSEYEGDRLKESRHYFDLMGLLAQIGAA